jgi:hypothetical protein
LPPDFCGFANVAETEPAAGWDFAAAAFFGLRISLFECVWPLAMVDLLRLGALGSAKGRASLNVAHCLNEHQHRSSVRFVSTPKNKKARRMAGLSFKEQR